jgi:hypothetical protein
MLVLELLLARSGTRAADTLSTPAVPLNRASRS